MFQVILSVVFIVFGIFLKNTTNPGFQSSKRMSIFLILLGIFSLIGSILLLFTKN